MTKSRHKRVNFLTALALVIITILLTVAVYARLLVLPVQLVWIGAVFIIIFTPIYHVAKKIFPAKIKQFLWVHTYGNIIAVMIVVLHLAQEIIQPQPYSTFLTGTLLGAIMILLLPTGFLLRFQPYLKKVWRNMHVCVTIAFYIVVILHVVIAHHNILEGLAILTTTF